MLHSHDTVRLVHLVPLVDARICLISKHKLPGPQWTHHVELAGLNNFFFSRHAVPQPIHVIPITDPQTVIASQPRSGQTP